MTNLPDVVPHRAWMIAVVVASLLITSCSRVDDAGVDRWVSTFHDHIKAQRYREIYDGADAIFKAQTSSDDWQAFLRNVVTNVGQPVSSRRRGPVVRRHGLEGAMVNAVYDTTYERGQSEERYTWRVRDGQLVLVGVTMDKK